MRILMIIAPDERGGVPLTIEQVIEPYYQFLDSRAEVVLASPGGGSPILTITGQNPQNFALRFQHDELAHDALTDTLGLDQVFSEDFQAAYCVGAPGIIEQLASHLVSELLAAGKPVAVVSNEPSSGLLITGTSPGLAANALLGVLLP